MKEEDFKMVCFYCNVIFLSHICLVVILIPLLFGVRKMIWYIEPCSGLAHYGSVHRDNEKNNLLGNLNDRV